MSTVPIPVLRPRLPCLDEVAPFLQRIDESRIYSNHGPLWREFRLGLEQWLSARTGADRLHIVPTSNGTTAIEVALRLRALPARRLCLMPSYTFIASAHAVCNAGFQPYLLDIDASTLSLTPDIVEAVLPTLPEPPAAILVISAFGAPPDIKGWTAFERQSGIPVVFDAAAALASLDCIGPQPLAVSLHATKVFGIGEGGAIISADPSFADTAAATAGFGFTGTERVSTVRGGNFRISEYGAAIGLAVLAGIETKITTLKCIGRDYATALEGHASVLQTGAGTEWPTMTLNVVVPAEELDRTLVRLDAEGVQWRRWWGFGTHRHPAFCDLPRTDLYVTDKTAPRIIGLPVFEELTGAQINRIADLLP